MDAPAPTLFTVLYDDRPVALVDAVDGARACAIAADMIALDLAWVARVPVANLAELAPLHQQERRRLSTRAPTEGERYRWAVERSDIGTGSEVALAAIAL